MLTHLFISIILGIIALFSILFIKKYFNSVELLTNWLFIAAMLFLFSNIIEINQKWITPDNDEKAFWILTVYRLIWIPCLTLWLFVIYSIKKVNSNLKIIATVFWLLLMIGMQFHFKSLGLIQFTQWNGYFSFVEWLILWFLAVTYLRAYKFLLKKEEVT